MLSALLVPDAAFDCALRIRLVAVLIQKDKRAHEARRSLFIGGFAQLAQQLRVVRGVVAMLAGVARGEHAWRAIERIDLEPRVVRKHGDGVPERFLRGLPSCLCLDARVAEEAVGVLGRVGVDVRLFERAEFPSREVEGVSDFFRFVGVVACNDDGFRV